MDVLLPEVSSFITLFIVSLLSSSQTFLFAGEYMADDESLWYL